MDEELAALRAGMADEQAVTAAGMELYTGTLAGVPVVLSRCGIGKARAAMGAALLCDRYQPAAVVNTGSAGGLDPICRIGDIVLGAETAYHDVDATTFGYAYGQVPREPARFAADEHVLALAREAAATMDLSGVDVHVGLIVSGDLFLDQPERIGHVRHHFPDALAAEMEGAAVAQACRHFGVPCLVVRSISDVAGTASRVDHTAYLKLSAENASRLVMGLLARWGS
ncbi:MAG: 5'-methylthioadenosine/adenosylhomocysteine nucleosidase [Alicyclobacillus sp.]|nr:5'-methylthioadenosine/adenosylhomocysteine nucleosidase [Alicyclobacillus sp.]